MSPSKPVHHHQLKVCHSALFEPVAKCWWCWRWWWRSWHLYHFSSWESLPVSPCRGHRWTSSPQPPPPTPPETSKCLSSVINMMPNQYHHHCLVIDINFKSTHLHDKIHFDNPHKGHLILFSWGSSWTFILPEYNLKMKAMLNFTLAVNIISWYQLVYIKFRTTNWKSTSKVQAARVWDNCILQHGQNTRTQENAKIFFPLGATRAWSLNLWAAKFPHYNSDPVFMNFINSRYQGGLTAVSSIIKQRFIIIY